ncbi:MAG: MaoC/PaaZ C-terminal domain-containing protein [Cohaesibacter sp.]|jgi:acyl dehydratase|nr:MaoC/PaaZ C-terminal domain-containing protein [Cohaesibacter sp.]
MSTLMQSSSPVVGDKQTKLFCFSQQDFNAFADLSGDDNPIHVDPDFSAKTRFGKTVSHGMLLYSHLWGMIQLAYPGAVQMEQVIKFPAPTFTEEEVLFEIEITEVDDKGQLHLITRASTPSRGTVGLEGASVIAWEGAPNA